MLNLFDLYKPFFSARYMVRNADWGVISANSAIYDQAFGTVVSFADGADATKGSGTPYFYIAEMSTTWKVTFPIFPI